MKPPAPATTMRGVSVITVISGWRAASRDLARAGSPP
jgi:hypothetical protein